MPLTTSTSKAHGRLKVDRDFPNGLYVGIYEKNSNMYKSTGYNTYMKRKLVRDKNELIFGKGLEKTFDEMKFPEKEYKCGCGYDDDEWNNTYVSSSPKLDKVPLGSFVIERKQNSSDRKERKKKPKSNATETKKQKFKYYWDYVNTNIDEITDDNSGRQSNHNIQEKSFLEDLPELRKITCRINREIQDNIGMSMKEILSQEG